MTLHTSDTRAKRDALSRELRLLAALLFTSCMACAASAAIVGTHDRTDWSAIQGWVCDDRDPAPLTVYFFAMQGGRLVQIGNATANRYRSDVERSAACASGYHGFVFTDVPLLLVDGEAHAIYAYAQGPQQRLIALSGTPRVLETRPRGLWDPRVASGRWRTDYVGSPGTELEFAL